MFPAIPRRRGRLVLLALLASLAAPLPAAARGPLEAVESEFRRAIERVLPATVLVAPRHAPAGLAGSSSGVLVSSSGLLLSDGDAGLFYRVEQGQRVRVHTSDVEIRVPDAHGGAVRLYRARVLARDLALDASLIQVLDVPQGGFPAVTPASSDSLVVGDLLFALGSSFDEEGRTPATLTVGILSATTPRHGAGPGGRYEHLFTSAAVNEGVNGGPLVDLNGRLVGTISTYVNPLPDEPHQFLGKAVPMDRILAAFAHHPEGALLARLGRGERDRVGREHALEVAFQAAARTAAAAVVSLEVRRKSPVVARVPFDREGATVPRYGGAVSGILLSEQGEIVTSLYNLADVATLVEPLWRAPSGAEVADGLGDVLGITVHLGGGRSVPARVLGYDLRLGLCLLQAASASPSTAGLGVPLWPAPGAAFERGRFVVAVGNPYGEAAGSGRLVTVGILSKEHPDDVAAAWRGQWQTDAAGLDTNCGGAAVDLEGRLYGMLQIWYPAKHGRNSGIAFVVPWSRIQAALPAMRLGQVPARGLLGIRFAAGVDPVIEQVESGSGAERAGIRPGDRIRAIDREETATVAEVVSAIRFRFGGERVRVALERDGALRMVEATLGER